MGKPSKSARVQMIIAPTVHEAYRQLNNTTHYNKLIRPIYLDEVHEINNIIQTLLDNKYITKKLSFYLRWEENPNPIFFYLLPKIHKPPQSWSIPYEVPAGRLIVSDCNSESYRVAEHIDYFLTPLSTKHSSYIKDTYDLRKQNKKTLK